MRFEERDFNMKTRIWGTTNEFSQVMIQSDRKDMNDFLTFLLKNFLPLIKFKKKGPRMKHPTPLRKFNKILIRIKILMVGLNQLSLKNKMSF